MRAPSIVERDFQGRLTPVAEPDWEAIQRLQLAPEVLVQVEAIHDQRIAQFTAIALENLGLIQETAGRLQGGDPGTRGILGGLRVLAKFRPYLERGSMVEECEALLGPQANPARAMVVEYAAAAARELHEEEPALGAREIANRLRLQALGKLVEQVVTDRAYALQALGEARGDDLGLTEEQRQRIGALVDPLAALSGKASLGYRIRFLGGVWEVLTPFQRGLVLGRLLGSRG